MFHTESTTGPTADGRQDKINNDMNFTLFSKHMLYPFLDTMVLNVDTYRVIEQSVKTATRLYLLIRTHATQLNFVVDERNVNEEAENKKTQRQKKLDGWLFYHWCHHKVDRSTKYEHWNHYGDLVKLEKEQ